MTHWITELIATYGYGLVFLVVTLESMGAPLPGESMVIAAALYAGTTHNLSVTGVVLAAAIGAILGDNGGFLIGKHLGRRVLVRYGRHVGLTEQRLDIGRLLVRRHGSMLVFFGRFIGILRTFVSIFAGANGMDWKRFSVANAAGGVLWASAYGFGAAALGERAHSFLGPIAVVAGAVAAVAIVGTVVVIRRQEAKLAREAASEAASEAA